MEGWKGCDRQMEPHSLSLAATRSFYMALGDIIPPKLPWLRGSVRTLAQANTGAH